MPDPRVDAITGAVARVEGVACWLARLATRAAMVGAVAALALWWVAAGDRVDEWWRGTAASLLVLALALAPAAWLVNVRVALLDLVALPGTLRGVTTRRRGMPTRPDGGLFAAVRAVRDIVRDYGDVAGSWGTVAQVVAPTFWLLTTAALAAVPVLAIAAAIAVLVSR